MEHYVCTGGCGGINIAPGVCDKISCENYSHPLVVCHCKEGTHEGLLNTCEQCGKPIPSEQKICEPGKCDIDTFKPEITG